MKKQFFYAALAIAMMSSCSKDNDPGNNIDQGGQNGQEVIDDTTPAEIQLGISAPQISATTRGTGTVGSEVVSDNKWNGQPLHIWMLDSEGKVATEKSGEADVAIFGDDLTFKAPTTGTTGKVQILKNETTVQAKYYPLAGVFSFYGYHIDGLTGTPNIPEKKVTGITITGSEDLMAAKTKVVNEINYADAWASMAEADKTLIADRSFSAWSARRGVQPILDFQHLLTRLKFAVIAGNEKAAVNYYKDGGWSGSNAITGQSVENTAVRITGIDVINVANSVDIDLSNTTASASEGAATNQKLTLMGSTVNASGNLEALTATSPQYFSTGNYDKDHPEATPVGESLMLLPGASTISLMIHLEQLVVDTENASGDALTYISKTADLPATVSAANVTDADGKQLGAGATFDAQKSYNINIKVFGFERIEISASLAPWENGGSVEVNPEDDAFNTPTPTPGA